MSTTASLSRAPSLVAIVGAGLGAGIGVAGCSLPSAKIETPAPAPAPAPTKHEVAAKTKAAAKARRKSATRGRGPTVIAAELLGDGDRLRLHFSEPLAPTRGVDPNDFRLSVALAYIYKLYAYAYYYDPGEYGGDEPMAITALDGAGEILELRLEPAFPISYCLEMQREVQDMRSEPGVKADGGLFLHYAPGEIPITDAEGNGVAAIAAEWVLRRRRGDEDADEMYFEGPLARRALRDPIPVRCGPELPPGPR